MDTKYLKRVALYTCAVLFSIAMVLYISYHLYMGLTGDIVTAPAQESSRSFTVRGDAYIFREEQTIPRTSSAGQLSPETVDGSHVAAGSAVAKIYANPDPAAEAQIASLKAQLSLLNDYAAANHGAKDAAEIDQRIYSALTQIKLLTDRNDYAGVIEMRSELLANLNERAAISGTDSGSIDDMIVSVEAQLETQTSALGSPLETVIAPRSGWFYADADGYESIFTPEALAGLTLENYETLIRSAPADTSTAAGKLVTDYLWYIAVRIDAVTAAGMSAGSKYDVAFAYNGGEVLSMTLDRVVTAAGADDAIVIFSSGEIGKDFSFTRRQTVDITARVITGFAVPRSAVRIVNGEMGVYIFDGVRSLFRRIEVIKEFDDVYIVASDSEEDDNENTAPYLKQNELIITEGKGMYDGKVIA